MEGLPADVTLLISSFMDPKTRKAYVKNIFSRKDKATLRYKHEIQKQDLMRQLIDEYNKCSLNDISYKLDCLRSSYSKLNEGVKNNDALKIHFALRSIN